MANPAPKPSEDRQKRYLEECANVANRKTATNIIENGYSSEPPCKYCRREGVPCMKTEPIRRCALCASKGRTQYICDGGKEIRKKRQISQVESPSQQPQRTAFTITLPSVMPEEEVVEPPRAPEVINPPEIPKASEIPKVPEISKAPMLSKAPEIPEAPQVLQPPYIPPQEATPSPTPSPSDSPSTEPTRSPSPIPSPPNPLPDPAAPIDISQTLQTLERELRTEIDKKLFELSQHLQDLRDEVEVLRKEIGKNKQKPKEVKPMFGNVENVFL